LGWGFWALGPNPNPQSPIPNPQSPIPNLMIIYVYIFLNKYKLNKLKIYYEKKYK